MQQHQLTPGPRLRRRSETRGDISLGLVTTALIVTVVLVLLATTFLADWMHVPEFTLSSNTPYLSPNGDRDHDLATVSYELAEAARVTVRVLGESGGVVRMLLDGEDQAGGQHFVSWDGRNEVGAQVDDGRYRLEITASGAMRGTTKSVMIEVVTRPPALQLANLNDGTRVGQEILTVQGVTEPDTVVWVNDDAQPITADNQGRFAFQRKLVEGSNLIEVRVVDAAGNSARLGREVVLVTTPPDVIVSQPADGVWTNQAIAQIQGKAAPGSTVIVNGQPVTIEDDGDFHYEVLLNEGQNLIKVEATDDVGNVTTLERVVYLKTVLPDVSLNIADGARVSDSLLQIAGTTDPGTTILINRRVVPVSTLGDFQTSLFLTEGDNVIQIEARDQAGNFTQLSRRVELASAQPVDNAGRVWRNLNELPILVVPVLTVTGLLVAFFLVRRNQVSLILAVSQNTFTPGLPGENKLLELSLDLNKPARVSLEVLDASGNILATLLRNRRRLGRVHMFHWDGYDDYGRPVRPGEYTIQATAGSPPIRVTSAVQISIQQDAYVHRQLEQQPVLRGRRNLDGQDDFNVR